MTHDILTTERTILKSMTPAHVHELFNTRNKEEIIRFLGCSEASYIRYYEMHEKGMETDRLSHFYFLIHDKQTQLPIGECGFHTWNQTHRKAEMFYLLHDDTNKQKGIMSEVLPVVIRYGYLEMGLHRVQACVADWNTPSVKLLQRNNFTKEGTLREDYRVDGKNEDSDCYSLLRWEWDKKSN